MDPVGGFLRGKKLHWKNAMEKQIWYQLLEEAEAGGWGPPRRHLTAVQQVLGQGEDGEAARTGLVQWAGCHSRWAGGTVVGLEETGVQGTWSFPQKQGECEERG